MLVPVIFKSGVDSRITPNQDIRHAKLLHTQCVFTCLRSKSRLNATHIMKEQACTLHKEREQFGDQRNVGESSCNSGDGTGQMAQPLMFMMIMMMMMMTSLCRGICHQGCGYVVFVGLPIVPSERKQIQILRHSITPQIS
jgi:hypothetical protein